MNAARSKPPDEPALPSRVSLTDAIPISCAACTGQLVALRHPRLDERGQLHLDEASRLSVDLPLLRAHWHLAQGREAATWARRGEAALYSALQSERAYWRGLYVPGAGESGAPRIVDLGEYVPELDGDPESGW